MAGANSNATRYAAGMTDSDAVPLSAEARAVIAELRALKHDPKPPLAERRAAWEAQAGAEPLPAGIESRSISLTGGPSPAAARSEPPAVQALRVGSDPVRLPARVLLFHGGGYLSGSSLTHRAMAGRLASHLGCEVVVVDYRRAPEHPFPAAVDDCLVSYQASLESGLSPERLALVGDSAGGGLVLAVLQRAQACGLPMPAAGVLLSPWLDLQIDSPSGTENAESDPSILREHLVECGAQYVAGQDPRQPLASPLYSDPTGFCPLYINVGDSEILLDDALIFARAAQAAGVDTTLSVGRGLWHVYPAWAGQVPEAASELERVGAYLGKRLRGA